MSILRLGRHRRRRRFSRNAGGLFSYSSGNFVVIPSEVEESLTVNDERSLHFGRDDKDDSSRSGAIGDDFQTRRCVNEWWSLFRSSRPSSPVTRAGGAGRPARKEQTVTARVWWHPMFADQKARGSPAELIQP